MNFHTCAKRACLINCQAGYRHCLLHSSHLRLEERGLPYELPSGLSIGWLTGRAGLAHFFCPPLTIVSVAIAIVCFSGDSNSFSGEFQ